MTSTLNTSAPYFPYYLEERPGKLCSNGNFEMPITVKNIDLQNPKIGSEKDPFSWSGAF